MRLDARNIENIKTLAIGSSMALGIGTGLFFLARHLINRVRTNSAQKHSLEEGDPSTAAKQLKMSFENDNYFGWGTNVIAVKKVFSDLPSKSMYSKVQREYNKLYNRNLNADLEDELSSSEYNEIISILNSKK